MATTKKATTKQVPINSIVLSDNILWAVIERRMLHPQVIGLFKTQSQAEAYAAGKDTESGLSFNKYIVQRVELV